MKLRVFAFLIFAAVVVVACAPQQSGESSAVSTTSEEYQRNTDETSEHSESETSDARIEEIADRRVLATISANLDGNSELDELVFLGNQEESFSDDRTADIDRLAFRLNARKEIAELANPNIWTVGYRAKELRVLEQFSDSVGSPHPHYVVSDINSNGRDEYFLWRIGGMGSSIEPWEYRDDGFRRLVDDPGGIEIVTGLELVGNIENCPCGYRVYGIGRAPGVPPGMRNWVEYAWSQEVQLYVIVDEGVEEWEGDWFSED